jgi:PAS domain-containing protein
LEADRHRCLLIYPGASFQPLVKIGHLLANKDLVMSEETEENREFHRRLNLTPSMLSAIEPDGRYTWLNEVALQYFGRSAADITSGDLRRRVVLPDDFERVRERPWSTQMYTKTCFCVSGNSVALTTQSIGPNVLRGAAPRGLRGRSHFGGYPRCDQHGFRRSLRILRQAARCPAIPAAYVV